MFVKKDTKANYAINNTLKMVSSRIIKLYVTMDMKENYVT